MSVDNDRCCDEVSDDSGLFELARNDNCWDGSWMCSGLNGMMVALDNPNFEDYEYQDFLDEKEANSSLDEEEEFVHLNFQCVHNR